MASGTVGCNVVSNKTRCNDTIDANIPAESLPRSNMSLDRAHGNTIQVLSSGKTISPRECARERMRHKTWVVFGLGFPKVGVSILGLGRHCASRGGCIVHVVEPTVLVDRRWTH